ncbi:hypothetical protein LTR66_015318 [Elasticomyces elasticus]|nr:hypothetical protein LTR66_015318 [Elasticomyces elasticus]KAK4975677.1 hypothetical protein LTR28_008898 [Elasticomyces elasticus]KAK4985788.1 hypothetical protein LTR50_005746 [Elasticomyces elasticus]
MDFVKNFTGGASKTRPTAEPNTGSTEQISSSSSSGGGGGFLSGFSNKLNSAAGGGVESEKNEDYLDKGIDLVQQHILGQGPQNNESALEQAKDEQMSDYIRAQYRSKMGSEMPIKDKETRFG